MRIPRSRGAVSGVVLVILGAWGALAPLIGPSFDFSTDSTSTWNLTNDTFWLSVVPGVAAVVAGLILLTSANRATAGLGAWLGIAAGAWFVVGDQITDFSVSEAGEFEHLAAFDGLGAAIAAVAAFALGRLAVRSVRDEELTREAELADRDGDGVPERPVRTDESNRLGRDRETVAANGSSTGTPTVTDRDPEASDEPRGRKLFRRS